MPANPNRTATKPPGRKDQPRDASGRFTTKSNASASLSGNIQGPPQGPNQGPVNVPVTDVPSGSARLQPNEPQQAPVSATSEKPSPAFPGAFPENDEPADLIDWVEEASSLGDAEPNETNLLEEGAPSDGANIKAKQEPNVPNDSALNSVMENLLNLTRELQRQVQDNKATMARQNRQFEDMMYQQEKALENLTMRSQAVAPHVTFKEEAKNVGNVGSRQVLETPKTAKSIYRTPVPFGSVNEFGKPSPHANDSVLHFKQEPPILAPSFHSTHRFPQEGYPGLQPHAQDIQHLTEAQGSSAAGTERFPEQPQPPVPEGGTPTENIAQVASAPTVGLDTRVELQTPAQWRTGGSPLSEHYTWADDNADDVDSVASVQRASSAPIKSKGAHEDPSLIGGLRKSIPEYKGDRSKPQELLEFFQKTEHYYRAGNIRSETVVNAVIPKLVQHANIWWRSLTNPPTTWEAMKTALAREFQDHDLEEDLLAKLMDIKQTSGVASYNNLWRKLSMQIVHLAPFEAVVCYKRGLKPEIREFLETKHADGRKFNVDELMLAAIDREKRMKKPGGKGRREDEAHHLGNGGKQPGRKPGPGRSKCVECGGPHKTENCDKRRGSPGNRWKKKPDDAKKKQKEAAEKGEQFKLSRRQMEALKWAEEQAKKSLSEGKDAKNEDESHVLLDTNARSPLAIMLDGGSTRGVIKDRFLLDDYKPIKASRPLLTGTGDEVKIIGMGTLTVRDPDHPERYIEWKNVAYSPTFRRNLVPIAPLKRAGMEISLGGAAPGIYAANGERTLRLNSSYGLDFLVGSVETMDDVHTLEIDQSYALVPKSSENDRTATSVNYGTSGLDTLDRRPLSGRSTGIAFE